MNHPKNPAKIIRDLRNCSVEAIAQIICFPERVTCFWRRGNKGKTKREPSGLNTNPIVSYSSQSICQTSPANFVVPHNAKVGLKCDFLGGPPTA